MEHHLRLAAERADGSSNRASTLIVWPQSRENSSETNSQKSVAVQLHGIFAPAEEEEDDETAGDVDVSIGEDDAAVAACEDDLVP